MMRVEPTERSRCVRLLEPHLVGPHMAGLLACGLWCAIRRYAGGPLPRGASLARGLLPPPRGL
eukprot:7377144-Prymnesium_polylepis.1